MKLILCACGSCCLDITVALTCCSAGHPADPSGKWYNLWWEVAQPFAQLRNALYEDNTGTALKRDLVKERRPQLNQ